MSYEIYRNEILDKLHNYLPDHLLHRVITDIDTVSTAYEFSRKTVALSIVDEVPQALKLYIASKASRRLVKGTIDNYFTALKHFFEAVRKPIATIDANDIRVYLYRYSEERKVKNSTLRGLQNRIRDFFEWCTDEELIPKNPAKRIDPVKISETRLPSMTLVELETLRFACKDLREKAIVDFMYSTGCRVAELCAMQINDIDWQSKSAVVRHGKGNKARVVYLNAEAEVSLKAYIKSRTDNCPYLFVNSRKQIKHRITTRAIQRTINEIQSRAVIPIHVTPHTFRRTSATIALKNGMPVEQVQRMLGHAKIDTTIRYTTIEDSEVRYNHERCVI